MKFVHLRDNEEKSFIESWIFVCFNLWVGLGGGVRGGGGE